jgi:hypothetical protein
MQITKDLLKDRNFSTINLDVCDIHTKELYEGLQLVVYSTGDVSLCGFNGDEIPLGMFNTIERLDNLIEVLTMQD